MWQGDWKKKFIKLPFDGPLVRYDGAKDGWELYYGEPYLRSTKKKFVPREIV